MFSRRVVIFITLLYIMMKEITLTVPQGIGDIFWVYQKFSPYCDVINFNIASINTTCPVQRRSISWLKLFPKFGKYKQLVMDGDYYNRMCLRTDFSVKKCLEEASKGAVEYSCNGFLEAGWKLDLIDPDFPIERTVNLPLSVFHLKFDKYVLGYVSGSIRDRFSFAWTLEQWIDFFKLFYKEKRVNLPLVIIGANFDQDISMKISKALEEEGIETQVLIGLKPSAVCYVIKNCEFFIAYQSGLSVIADNLDVRQLMMYFPTLRNMVESWPKPKHIGDFTYNYAFFDQEIDEVIELVHVKNLMHDKIYL